ncbi:hypothetical protein A9995_11345 [Erythrobacter sp. QSSC1-22B]|nr:hypothetical protein A9995_11345 [Erythrobacter sp. QSSC1-22B]
MLLRMKKSLLLGLTVLLGACEITPTDGSSVVTPAMAATERDTPELRGMSFAQNRCADCHAVERLHSSPVPAAPSFEAVANVPGVTRESLTQWLKTSHDYPREMYFEIPAERIDDLVAYMLTLRSDDYEPSIGLAPDASKPAGSAGSLGGMTTAAR